MLKSCVIQPSIPVWASPDVLAPKKDGTLRFCDDIRRLNVLARKYVYPVARIDECIGTLGETQIFTTLEADSVRCPWPTKIERKLPSHLTLGFTSTHASPPGLANASSTFRRALDISLEKYKWRTFMVHIDDVIVFSKSVEDHVRHVDDILKLLGEAGIFLTWSKCEFFYHLIKCFGHIIRPGEFEIDACFTKSLGEASLKNCHAAAQFSWCCQYLQTLHRWLCEKAAQLYELLRDLPASGSKGSKLPIDLTAISSLPVLALSVADRRFSVHTDGAPSEIIAALYQENQKVECRPVGYWSRQLNPSERNYSVTEKE